MKNIGTGILAFLAFSLCCGGPLIIGSLSLASAGLFAGDILVGALVLIAAGVGVILHNRKRRARHRRCEETE